MVYVALLRGVNVGNNVLPMERLRAICSKLGLKRVATYVQSGNVVFEAAGSADRWAKAIEGKLAGETRLPVTVVVRTAPELARIVRSNPFLKESGIDATRLHVTFVQAVPAKSALTALGALAAGKDRLKIVGREIYLHCPNGYGNSKLSNAALERVLSAKTTTRNWNTVRRLHDMSR